MKHRNKDSKKINYLREHGIEKLDQHDQARAEHGDGEHHQHHPGDRVRQAEMAEEGVGASLQAGVVRITALYQQSSLWVHGVVGG